jgi:hypothetical protein
MTEKDSAYNAQLKKAAKLLGENTMHLIGCIIEKHDAAIIEAGLEMKARIKKLELENKIMHEALKLIICDSINAEQIAEQAIDAALYTEAVTDTTKSSYRG